MIRKKKRFVRPKKAFEKIRIKEENEIMQQYALKNKKEIWKTIAKVNYYRRRAKILAKEKLDEQEILFGKLRALGLNIKGIPDVLALSIHDLLRRRLPVIVTKKNLSQSPRHARQMIIHKKVLINGKAINSPSYLVPLNEENQITVKIKMEKKPELNKVAGQDG